MDDTNSALQDPLAILLEARLVDWKRARDPQEQKLLDCYMDVMRIPRDGDTSGTGHAKSKKAKGLFMGSTRNKVRSARAKINDSLFGNGELPFDTNPTNEQLAPFADVVEDILTEQLERMKFRDMLSAGVNTLATYGTGFIFGPFVRREALTETYPENVGGSLVIREQKYEFDFPYFELGNTLDVIPDPDCRSRDDATGFFWVTMEAPHKVLSWKGDKSYKNIDAALLCIESDKVEGSERARQMRGTKSDYWHDKGRIKVARYFGKIPKRMLSADEAAAETVEQIDAVVVVAGGVVVKVDKSPWTKNPVLPCPYEAADQEIWGVGVAENNAPNQKNINAAFRLMNEGKGIALLPPISVDRHKFMPTESFKLSPGRVFEFMPGLSADEKREAIIVHAMPDVSDGWMNLISMSEQFSDDDTAITKYGQGDDARNLNKTATGISMIMSASALPIKEVIQHIDAKWIEPIIESLIEWNLKYLDAETVEKIHGKEKAATWQQIKEFGKASFMEWKATGTSSFMAKEVLVNKIRAFAEFSMGNPMTAQLIDARELLEQVWNSMEIGGESPVAKDDAKIPPQVQQQMAEMQQQLQGLGEEFNRVSGELEAKSAEQLMKRYQLETERLKVLLDVMPAQVAQIIAQEFGIDVASAPDITPQELEVPEMAPEQPIDATPAEPMPDEMPPDLMTQPEQPADAGFFTPERP
jgi:hypothetical protein